MKYSKCVSKCLISLLFWPLLVACSASNYSNKVSDQGAVPPVASKPIYSNDADGAINGRAWKFATGKAFLFKRNGQSYLQVNLWNQDIANPCGEYFGSTFQVRLYTQNQVGSISIDPSDPFNLIPTLIFSDLTQAGSSRNNMVANEGTITIDSIANGHIKGSVSGKFQAGNVNRTEISGNFDVPFCQQKSGSY